MPESAETRLTADFLESNLKGNMITRWGFVSGRYCDEPPEGFEEFENALPMKVDEVSCKGKFIYASLRSGESSYHVLHSLMMTGRWQKDHDDFCKWFVETDTGTTLWFSDHRALGTVKFTDDPRVLQSKIDGLGPDILRPEFSLPVFKGLVAKFKNRNITSMLMDQAVISGCGNVIKAEALYYAKVSPLRKTGSLMEREQEILFEGVKIIPRLAYNAGGISIKDFEVDGVKGEFQQELKIYGKPHAKRTKTADGRTTYWAPDHQV